MSVFVVNVSDLRVSMMSVVVSGDVRRADGIALLVLLSYLMLCRT